MPLSRLVCVGCHLRNPLASSTVCSLQSIQSTVYSLWSTICSSLLVVCRPQTAADNHRLSQTTTDYRRLAARSGGEKKGASEAPAAVN